MAVADLRILGLGLITAVWNMIATVERRDGEHIYISNWYTIGGTLWTIVIVVVSILPWYQFGLGQVAVQAFYMHNAVDCGLCPYRSVCSTMRCRSF